MVAIPPGEPTEPTASNEGVPCFPLLAAILSRTQLKESIFNTKKMIGRG